MALVENKLYSKYGTIDKNGQLMSQHVPDIRGQFCPFFYKKNMSYLQRPLEHCSMKISRTFSSGVLNSYTLIVYKFKTKVNKPLFLRAFYNPNPIFIPHILSINKHMFRPCHLHWSHHISYVAITLCNIN